MSMEPVLLGVAAPAVASGLSAVSRASGAVAESFQNAFQSAGQLFSSDSEADISQAVVDQPSVNDEPRFALLSALLAAKPSEGAQSNLTIEDMQSHANNLQEDLQQRIQEALDNAGIKLEFPLRLKISGIDGSLEVDGSHPQRAVIEAALNSDTTLATDFQKLSTERNILDFYTRSRVFAKDFDSQPWQAIAKQTEHGNDRYSATLKVSEDNSRLQLQFD